MRLDVRGSSLFADQVIEVPAILAIAGRHGMGKSALQRLIAAVFGVHEPESVRPNGPRNDRRSHDDHYDFDGVVEATVLVEGSTITRSVDLTLSLRDRSAIWSAITGEIIEADLVGPAHAIGRYAYLNQEGPIVLESARTGRIPELFIALHDASPGDLDAMNRILSRRYDSLHVDVYDEVTPYITGTVDGRRVDNADMSHGELWFHFLTSFMLRYDLSGPLMIDEPESGIAPRAHFEVMQELARIAVGADIQLILGTHSPDIMYWFPVENILMAVPSPRGVLYVTPASRDELAEHLGYPRVVRALILVEDSFARAVFRTLCEVFDRRWVHNTEIVVVGGKSTARATAVTLASVQAFPVIAVLDGDERNVAGGEHELYLPGTMEPESELLAVAERRMDTVAALTSRSPHDVASAIYETYGVHHQQVISRAARRLNLSFDALLRGLVAAWIEDDTVRAQCLELLEGVEQAADGVRASIR